MGAVLGKVFYGLLFAAFLLMELLDLFALMAQLAAELAREFALLLWNLICEVIALVSIVALVTAIFFCMILGVIYLDKVVFA